LSCLLLLLLWLWRQEVGIAARARARGARAGWGARRQRLAAEAAVAGAQANAEKAALAQSSQAGQQLRCGGALLLESDNDDEEIFMRWLQMVSPKRLVSCWVAVGAVCQRVPALLTPTAPQPLAVMDRCARCSGGGGRRWRSSGAALRAAGGRVCGCSRSEKKKLKKLER
jgi:hypothetical protein